MSPRERNMLVGLGVIVVAALGFFLLTGDGGGPTEDAAPTTAPPPPQVDPSPTPRPERFRFFAGRDPFLPLIVADIGTGGRETTEAQTGDDGTGTVEEPAPDAEQRAQDGGGTSVGGHRVTLVDISGNRAQVTVDGETYTVREGERFAGSFRLVSIDGSCATFQHGDESFTLCEGGERK